MIDWTALVVFLILFGGVTVLGFAAANWRRGDLNVLHEWGLAGRRFGTLITWFLLGGDVYTAYTFVALPALATGLGALAFFPLTLITAVCYPLVFVFGPRFWAIAHKRHYITYADFARDRYDSKGLELIVAVTSIIAVMLYISLQLVGLQVAIKALGLTGTGWAGDVPVIVAFAILAAYTYRGGLRAPALVAIVKDILIYVTAIAAVIYIPLQLGGFANIFAAAERTLSALPKPASTVLAPAQYTAFVTLGIGSGLALFMYPNNITAVLSAKSTDVVRRNMAMLPAYTLMLGLIALSGYMALAAGLHLSSPNDAIPMLYQHFFPSWFFGMTMAAIGIGALVPAAVMSIAAANLYTRNIHMALGARTLTEREETNVAKTASLVVKLGALAAVLFLPAQYSIYYQLFAGALILQIVPTVLIGLYTRWFHRVALVAGWIAGIAVALWMIIANHFASVFTLHFFGAPVTMFIGIWALAADLLVAAVATIALDAARTSRGIDRTTTEDYVEVEYPAN
ncbi:MAG TPA: sodium:solute symporter family protein [Candidatus Eremiobacteraceae bacterium]|nr:sodium:solute symporter family protein [Candidatus Eremiobacteraceae bacterium]